MGDNQVLIASPSPSPHEDANRRWTDEQNTHAPIDVKLERNEGFEMGYGLTVKLNDNEIRMNEYAHVDSLTDAQHWSRFSPRGAQPPLQGLPQNLAFGSVSASPETSDSATPPSLTDSLQSAISDPMHPTSESFQSALHGPGPDVHDPSNMFRPYARDDELWPKGLPDYGPTKPGGLGLPYPSFPLGFNPTIGGSISESLAATNTLPLPGSYTYPQHGSFPDMFARPPAFEHHSTLFRPSQLSPPPTASTSSTSSGSSSPFMRGDAFEHAAHNDMYDHSGTWKQYSSNTGAYPSRPSQPYDPLHPPRGGQEWHTATCDPRGITAEDPHVRSAGYGDPIIPHPSHSPALSDHSASSSGRQGNMEERRGNGRSRCPEQDPGEGFHGMSKGLGLVPSTGSGERPAIYKIKKKPGVGPGTGEEMLGMGLEDVDERAVSTLTSQIACV
ncbi:hypothetical protein K439DRAFT_498636 [Ramaria rubella]|nr:hypothetical protein K439DRAFT_498636 [Ramaria rubella]